MPSEIWKDVFQPLSRCHLEPTGLVCRSWHGLADGPTAPARRLDHAAFLPPGAQLIHAQLAIPRERQRGPFFAIDEPYEDSPLTFEWNTDTGRAAPNFPMHFEVNRFVGNYNQAPEEVCIADSRTCFRA